jgi:small conductance mechanosensitive channel
MENLYLKYTVLIIATFLFAFFVNFFIKRVVGKYVVKYSNKIKADPTNFSFLKNSISFIIYLAATVFIFTQIPSLRNIGTALVASAGILAAIIGFASQKAFSNIISGIFILIFKPFGIGDVIEIEGNKMGTVEEITMRHTVIRDFENLRIVIPNSIISDATVVNTSLIDDRIRKHINFKVSYDTDIDLAIKVIQQEIMKHPLITDVRTDRQVRAGEQMVTVRVVELGEYYVRLKAYAWVKDFEDSFVLECDVNKSILTKFKENNIVIPFPHQVNINGNGNGENYTKTQNNQPK